MSQSLVLQAKGLKTATNSFTEAGSGSMITATNVVIDQPGVVAPRRGIYPVRDINSPFDPLEVTTASSAMTFFRDVLVVNCGDYLASWNDSAGATYYNNTTYAGVIGDASGYAFNTGYGMRFAQSNGNLFFTTDAGIRKIASTGSKVRYAGYRPTLAFDATTSTSGLIKWLQNGESVSYRVVLGYTDSNNNLILNSPRTQTTVTAAASGGPFSVDISIPLQADVAAGDIYQVYRSASTAAGVAPNDELGLVYEGVVTAAQVSAGAVTLSDIVDPDFIGASLYTNASQDGILQSNDMPPAALDMALFNNRMVYANLTDPHRYFLHMLSIDDTSGGVTRFDTISVAGQDYFFQTQGLGWVGPAAYANQVVQIGANGDPETNRAVTAQNLCKAINSNPNNTTVYAYYVSLPDELAGRILIEERTLNGYGFTVNANGRKLDGKVAAYNQSLPHRVVTGNSSWDGEIADVNFGFVRSAGVVTVYTNCDYHNFTVGQTITVAGLNGDTAFNGTFTVASVPANNRFTYSDARANADHRGASPGEYLYSIVSSDQDVTSPISTSESSPNTLAISKLQQPEAVPSTNRIPVASKTPILRILALRDRLFIFKTDGIWVLTGDGPQNYRVDLFDNTTAIIAPKTASVVGNRIFALTNQGVVAISGDSGVQIVSRDIETDLLHIINTVSRDNLGPAWGLGVETDRKYYMHLPTAPLQGCAVAYVYNLFTNTWTTFDIGFSCGAVSPATDILHYGHPTTGAIYRERKNLNYTDHADDQIPVTCTNVFGNTVTINTGVAEVGDIFLQAPFNYARVTAIESGGTVLTLENPSGFTTGASYVYKGFTQTVVWAVDAGGNPAVLKHFGAAKILLGPCDRLKALNFTFSTELAGYVGAVTVNAPSNGHYPVALPTYVPQSAQRCSLLQVGYTHTNAWDNHQVEGMSVRFRPGTERFTR